MNQVHIFILNVLIESAQKNAENIGVVYPKW